MLRHLQHLCGHAEDVLWLEFDLRKQPFGVGEGDIPILAHRDHKGVNHYVACVHHREMHPEVDYQMREEFYSSDSWYPCTITEGDNYVQYFHTPDYPTRTDEFLDPNRSSPHKNPNCGVPRVGHRVRVLVLAEETQHIVLPNQNSSGRPVLDPTGPVFWISSQSNFHQEKIK